MTEQKLFKSFFSASIRPIILPLRSIGRKYNPVRIQATKQILDAKRLITLLWLVAITARYLDTVRNAILHPFNKGADLDWAWILLVVISAQITSIALWRTAALRVWLAVGALVAAILIFRSGSAPAVARVIPVLLAAVCWGKWSLDRLKPQKLRPTESTILSFSLGLIFLAFAGLALALLGLLTTTARVVAARNIDTASLSYGCFDCSEVDRHSAFVRMPQRRRNPSCH